MSRNEAGSKCDQHQDDHRNDEYHRIVSSELEQQRGCELPGTDCAKDANCSADDRGFARLTLKRLFMNKPAMIKSAIDNAI